jgi:hypothetical protein
MYRKGLIELLQQRPWGLNELAEHLQTRLRELEDDLRHLLCSVKHQGHRVVIEPARCHHCGFTFKRDKLHKPGRCPQCRHTWILTPRIRLQR